MKEFYYLRTKDIGQKVNESLERGTEEYGIMEGFLNETLKKLPNFTSELVFRRDTLDKNKLNNLKQLMEKGDVLRTNKFLSTSKSRRTVESIFRGNTMFTIKSKNGKDIEKFSYYDGIFNPINEHEVLFKTQSSFEILGITKSKKETYKYEIFLEQIS